MTEPVSSRRFARIERLPPYVFNITAELKMAARRRGEDIVDFSMGNPDGPTPPHIVEKLCQVAQRPDTHGYSTSKGIPRLRRAISRWYADRYDVEIDPESEAIVTIGSKEGLAHLMLATLDRGDTVLVPNPSYPIHIYGAVIAGAQIRSIPMAPGIDFFAELERGIRESIPKPKMMILGFPSNPTAQCVELDFFERVIALAKQYDVLVVHDLAYADITFDGWKAPSIMQVPGAKDIAVEFFTLSKSYNMAGWRIGFMVGNAELVNALARIKSYHDYGTFTPLQVAAIAALEGDQQCVRDIAAAVPAAPRRAGQGPARGRLDGRQPARLDVRLGEDSRALRAARFAGVRQEAAGRGQGVGVAGHRLRRLRRRLRALRPDREPGPHPPGGARDQGDVPQGRPAGDRAGKAPGHAPRRSRSDLPRLSGAPPCRRSRLPSCPSAVVRATPSRSPAAVAGRVRKTLGDPGGLTDFGVNLLQLPPGAWSSQRHWHSHEDEFVYVLSGELVLVTEQGEQRLRAGEAAAFPKERSRTAITWSIAATRSRPAWRSAAAAIAMPWSIRTSICAGTRRMATPTAMASRIRQRPGEPPSGVRRTGAGSLHPVCAGAAAASAARAVPAGADVWPCRRAPRAAGCRRSQPSNTCGWM